VARKMLTFRAALDVVLYSNCTLPECIRPASSGHCRLQRSGHRFLFLLSADLELSSRHAHS